MALRQCCKACCASKSKRMRRHRRDDKNAKAIVVTQRTRLAQSIWGFTYALVLAMIFATPGRGHSCQEDAPFFKQVDAPTIAFASGDPQALHVTDFNLDGMDDILIANDGFSPRIAYGSRDKSPGNLFEPLRPITDKYNFGNVIVADFDYDTYPDIYFSSLVGGDVIVRNDREDGWTRMLPPLSSASGSMVCEESCFNPEWSNDGECQDGHTHSSITEPILCPPGGDCQDCMPRVPVNISGQPYVRYESTKGGIALDVSGHKNSLLIIRANRPPALLLNQGNFYFQEAPIATESDATMCNDLCSTSKNGICEDDSGDSFGCLRGTDCSDCGARPQIRSDHVIHGDPVSYVVKIDVNQDGIDDVITFPIHLNSSLSDVRRARVYIQNKQGGFTEYLPPAAQGGGMQCDNSCVLANNGICEDSGEGSNPVAGCNHGTDCSDCGKRTMLDWDVSPLLQAHVEVTDAAVEDLDRDGQRDLILCTKEGYENAVYLSSPQGLFRRSAETDFDGVTDECLSISVGDYDYDDYPDILAASVQPRGVELYNNNGRGGFRLLPSSGISSPVLERGLDPVLVGWGDFTGDDVLDAVVLKSNPPNTLFPDHDVFISTLLPRVRDVPVTVDTNRTETKFDVRSDAIFIDLNGDGHLDSLASTLNRNTGLEVLMGRGNGEYVEVVNFPPFTTLNGTTMRLGSLDCNDDGYSDVILVNADRAAQLYYSEFNNETGQVEWKEGLFIHAAPVSDSYDIDIGDLTNDSIPDVVTLSQGNLMLYTGKEDCTFAHTVSSAHSLYTGNAILDYDGDGVNDLFVTEDKGLNGHGEQLPPSIIPVHLTALGQISRLGPFINLSLKVEDIKGVNLDGNEFADFAIVNYKGDVTVYINANGTSMTSWTAFQRWAYFRETDASLTICDMNADGFDDIVVVDTAGPPGVLIRDAKMSISTYLRTADVSDFALLSPGCTSRAEDILRGLRPTVARCEHVDHGGQRIRFFDASTPTRDREMIVCAANESCTHCPPGTAGSLGKCRACPPGSHQAKRNASHCEWCAPGLYYSDQFGQQTCDACEAGTFSLGRGASSREECMTCPNGTDLGRLSLVNGSCPCLPNHFRTRSTEECFQCPVGTRCSNESVTIERGHWTKWNGTGAIESIFACPLPDACLEGPRSTCAEGHEGLLCNVCEEGYYLFGPSCRTCGSLAFPIVGALVMILGLMYLLARIGSNAEDQSSGTDDDRSEESEVSNSNVFYVACNWLKCFVFIWRYLYRKVHWFVSSSIQATNPSTWFLSTIDFIRFLQLFAVSIQFTSVLSFDDTFVRFLSTVSFVNMSWFRASSLECHLDTVLGSFGMEYVVTVAAFVVCGLGVVVVYSCCHKREEHRARKEANNDARQTMVRRILELESLLRVPILSRTAVIVVDARRHIDDECVFSGDYRIDCDSSTLHGLRIAAVLIVVSYIGLGTAFYLWMRTTIKELRERSGIAYFMELAGDVWVVFGVAGLDNPDFLYFLQLWFGFQVVVEAIVCWSLLSKTPNLSRVVDEQDHSNIYRHPNAELDSTDSSISGESSTGVDHANVMIGTTAVNCQQSESSNSMGYNMVSRMLEAASKRNRSRGIWLSKHEPEHVAQPTVQVARLSSTCGILLFLIVAAWASSCSPSCKTTASILMYVIFGIVGAFHAVCWLPYYCRCWFGD